MSWENLALACKRLGHHGICPEGLTVIGQLYAFLNEETRAEYDDFMQKARALFAPRETEAL